MNSFIVSTKCPSCDAPLDFSEGSNAVKCGHCGSNLLVTGRKQVLSYYVAPRLEERRAAAEAVKAQRDRGRDGFTGLKAHLYFLPYYRMTGQDLSCEKAPPKPKDVDTENETGLDEDGPSWKFEYHSSSSVFDAGLTLPEAAGKALRFIVDMSLGKRSGDERSSLFMNPKDLDEQENRAAEAYFGAGGGKPACGGSLYENGEVLLNCRYVEKNFIACDLQGVGLYSLGVRPAVLRLELFRREALDSFGKTVSPGLGPEAAESVGLKTAFNPALLYRKVIGRVLSIVYFPFWIIEMQSRGKIMVTIIDAVSQTVIKADADSAIYDSLNPAAGDAPAIMDFRPLICPNCGWDLAVRPEDVIFVCGSCGRAWQINGSRLNEVSYHVIDLGNSRKEAKLKYLPFWILTKSGGTAPFKFFIPAFRDRRPGALLDIALRLSRLQPAYSVIDIKPDLSGCYYDSEDAFLMAQFTQSLLASESIEQFKTGDDLSITESVLAWLPFELQGNFLTSPVGGLNIPKGLLF